MLVMITQFLFRVLSRKTAPIQRLSQKRFVGSKQRGDLVGLLFLAFSACLLLSLVPPSLLGSGALRLFPYDNFMGVVGRAIYQFSSELIGIGRFLLPLPPLIGALTCFGLIRRVSGTRWAYFFTGLIPLLPLGAYQLTVDAGGLVPINGARIGGWVGRELGFLLAALLSWFGALILVATLVAMYSIVTVGVNPLRVIGRLFQHFYTTIRPALRRTIQRLRGFKESITQADFGVQSVVTDSIREPSVSDVLTSSNFLDSTIVETIDPVGEPTQSVPEDELATPDPTTEATTDSASSPSLPGTDLLTSEPSRDQRLSDTELDFLGHTLLQTLNTFRIEGRIIGRTTGPVITQFEFVPAPGIKVSRIAALDADLALALKASSVRIVAPIPGKGAVGVEVPNPVPETVYLRDIIESAAFRGNRGPLPLALGKDLHGRPYVADLARMPHLLIAGATGSGKSVCINTIITSLIYRHSPESLRLLMIDPKMVELSMYGDLPHLRHPVVTDPNDAAHVLKWAVYEMERRYKLLSMNNARSIKEFNQKLTQGRTLVQPGAEPAPYTDGPLPYIVVVVDELADLMMAVQGDVERPLAQLAQKARAIGIHLIVATQRPSVNVITGLIKANFPTRIAFRVASKIDSRTILDQNGAESLLGNGDMLFLPPGTSDPVRIQGAFLSTEDTERLMDWYRVSYANHAVEEDDVLEIVRTLEETEAQGFDDIDENRDPLFRQAAEICIQHQQGSTSLLQRRLKIGYGRAARIVDQLHAAGVLGPPDGSRPREVLVGYDALDLIAS